VTAVVRKLNTEEEILAARRVMRQLRPQISEAAYLETVQRMMKTDGYLQAAVFEGDTVVAVTGYRFMEMLYAGKTLYVDDQHGRISPISWPRQDAHGLAETAGQGAELRSAAARFWRPARADAPVLFP
jgi:hypothetical protein